MGCNNLLLAYRRYVSKEIESIFPTMKLINNVKRENFIVRIESKFLQIYRINSHSILFSHSISISLLFIQETANEHNENLCNSILSMIKEGAIAEIRMSGHLDEYRMNSLYLGMKDVAFEMVSPYQ